MPFRAGSASISDVHVVRRTRCCTTHLWNPPPSTQKRYSVDLDRVGTSFEAFSDIRYSATDLVHIIALTSAYFYTLIYAPGDHALYKRFFPKLNGVCCAVYRGTSQRASPVYLTLLFVCNPGVRNNVLNSTINYFYFL